MKLHPLTQPPDGYSDRRGGRPGLFTALLIAATTLFSCAELQTFDDAPGLEDQFRQRVAPEYHHLFEVPFALQPQVLEEMEGRVPLAGGEDRRRDAVLDFIFGHVGLEYSLQPTKNAWEAFVTGQANCLSFVNLFVGVARERRLNPFYVEVEDYQRWNYQDGVVVSRGHIVAGLRVDGKLATYDFLPYRAKSYRDFQPISDLAAMAHYYNNLGAEALMRGQVDEAKTWLEIATSVAPDFDKAANNLGIVRLRTGDTAGAIAIYEKGLELHPDNTPLLSNLARAYQQAGDDAAANQVLDRLEEQEQASPFFYIYRGDVALARGDTVTALDYMRRAFKADSELPEVHIGLVRVYLAVGKTKEAKHHVERALRLDATHDEARKYAAMLRAAARAPATGGGDGA